MIIFKKSFRYRASDPAFNIRMLLEALISVSFSLCQSIMGIANYCDPLTGVNNYGLEPESSPIWPKSFAEWLGRLLFRKLGPDYESNWVTRIEIGKTWYGVHAPIVTGSLGFCRWAIILTDAGLESERGHFFIQCFAPGTVFRNLIREGWDMVRHTQMPKWWSDHTEPKLVFPFYEEDVENFLKAFEALEEVQYSSFEGRPLDAIYEPLKAQASDAQRDTYCIGDVDEMEGWMPDTETEPPLTFRDQYPDGDELEGWITEYETSTESPLTFQDQYPDLF